MSNIVRMSKEEKEKEKDLCKKGQSSEECELAILRHQVDAAQEKLEKRMVAAPEIKEMIKIVEEFIKRKGLVAYGGIAINALLPEDEKIYDDDLDLPDYDFFSPNALEDAKELADIYYKRGYTEVEAKSGQHAGTFKVFVNFLGMADVTGIPKELYDAIKSKAVMVDGIYYTDANFLKMSMFLELSRPAGDTSRWEKVLKRLQLINKNYPMDDDKCDYMNFQRKMGDEEKGDEIYEIVKNAFINAGVVFFGGYAIAQYSQYMPAELRKQVEKNADFDVLANNPETTAKVVKERLNEAGFKNVSIIRHDPVGEIIPVHYELKVGKEVVAFLYKTTACHSYNVLMQEKKKVKVATIDTMLNFYLAFLYANRPYYTAFTDRIMCMAKFLFDVQQKNRLEQKGLLKRFSITCYGHQESREDMRAEKAEKFKELQSKRGSKEFEEYFLNYRPTGAQKNGFSPTKPKPSKHKKTKSKKRVKKSGNFFNFFNVPFTANSRPKRSKRKTRKTRNFF
jgi:hypothetical protein